MLKAHDELEIRVKERTVELSKVNEALKKEITERKQVEESLQKSEQSYRILFDSTINGLFVVNAETMKVALANQPVIQMYGFDSVDDVVEKNPLDFIAPNDRDRAAGTIMTDMFEKDLRQIVEFKTTTTDVREIWISTVGTRTEYQRRLAGLVSISDITKSKLMETQLRQAQKIEGVCQLAGGIAHDFNNILTVIQGNAELAMMDIDESDPMYINLKRIRDSVIHSTNLTRQLLIFSRKQPMIFITLNLNRIIDDFMKMLHRLIGEDIAIESGLDPEL